ncbi:MAG: MFS transporter [Chloroflexi bacterium]|nr:MFS transporter [Chloroflexota bacterium]MDA1147625.1 MFS transporter [Chloroflexota bacterium]
MRTFHITWFAFFLAFFGWFGIAPLMAVVREDLELTKTQVGNTVIASVAVTVIARLFIGWLSDRIGPRRAYTWLLILGAFPVMGIGLAQNYETFVLFRLAIGVIGASFVITQYHTSVMFAPNVVGTANATTAGWGNLGGGVTQMVMPFVLSLLVLFGLNEAVGWRFAMVVPGIALFAMGIVYYKYTQDTPDGDFKDLRARGLLPPASATKGSFWAAARDYRVWALFVIYGACFGIELTINNVAALYYHDRFELSVGVAGLIAGLFGLMNLFARSLGGIFGDRAGARFGLRGRVIFLGVVLALEGVALLVFSQMAALALAIPAMIVFSIFVQMSEGATFSVVPFVNPKALGSVAGIVGAGGNAGAVGAGFLFRMESLATEDAFAILGVLVLASSVLVALVRFAPQAEAEAAAAHREAAPRAVPALAAQAQSVTVRADG